MADLVEQQAPAQAASPAGATAALAHAAAAEGEARPGPGRQPWLLAGLREQEGFLRSASEYFRRTASEEALSYAAEWMLDNFYLAQQALRQVREDMPVTFYRELPKLEKGPLVGYPRVYELAQHLVASSGGRLDLATVREFVVLYQEVRPLTTGELWALPLMLRLSVLGALSHAISGITGLAQPAPLPALPLPAGLTGDEIVANAFTSLRTINAHDWKRFFEQVSPVEHALRADPANIYARMDRETRDHYRKVVEALAQGGDHDELEVARAAVTLARRAADDIEEQAAVRRGGDSDTWDGLVLPAVAHVGYYLLDDGIQALEHELGQRPSPQERLRRWVFAHASLVYLSAILAVAAALAISASAVAAGPMAVVAFLLSVVPALTIAVSLVNWVVTLAVPPRVLPKLDFDSAIPEQCRTLVVIPALLGSRAELASLLEQIELHYLRNPAENVYFGLLTDFTDATEAILPEDQALLDDALAGIRSLNARYAASLSKGEGPFCLFHRERRWNPGEGRWMGWERKRGKLHELNRWLRGADDTSFVVCEGPTADLHSVRYVITLDADTVLGRDGARRLIGTIAHPLNRAQFAPGSARVAKGHALLQPRTEITPASANYSWFSRTFAGDIGLDLYTRAVSDVYQDLFGSGIYVGKGIYDVDAFEHALAGRVPENALLSHDLFEGILGRVGLVTDIVLYEDYPPSYLAFMRRQLRWMRGDWQLIRWLWPRVPSEGGRPRGNDFQAIDLWKLVDNLRRSLVAPSLILLLAAAWLVLPGRGWAWTLAAVLTLAVPVLLGALAPFISALRNDPWQKAGRSLSNGAARWLLAVTFMPYEAAEAVRAIGLTLLRTLVTHRHMLEWTTAAEAARRFGNGGGRGQAWQMMRSAPFLAAILALLVALIRPDHLPLALPLLILWALAPEVAYRSSQPLVHEPAPLPEADIGELRNLARRTWLFFERFVGPEDHWLPPDHFQEAPRGVIAPYTSPTNIGLLLLATLSAYDQGYIGAPLLVTRLQSTFETLVRLERYRGHFLNWYDTRSLEPLQPRYVSVVDSGNLAACLVILRQACLDIPGVPILRWERWEGLADTYSLFDDLVEDLHAAGLDEQAVALGDLLTELKDRILQLRGRPEAWLPALDYAQGDGWTRLQELLARLIDLHTPALGGEPLRRLRIASEHVRNQIFVMHRYVHLIAPWLPMLNARPPLLAPGGTPESLVTPLATLLLALDSNPPLAEEPALCEKALQALAGLEAALQREMADPARLAEARAWCAEMRRNLEASRSLSQEMLDGLETLARQCDEYFEAMDFAFLFDSHRQVFHIGYNVTAGKLDDNYYDLLASEARIASIVALARHQVPRSHWLHLARPLTEVSGIRALLSWSATMFEYLMPPLFMRSAPGTLLHESEVAAADHQIAYGRRLRVPWGISESGYYAFDANQNYQYRAFGVPGLGFKRNLGEDLVIAPYASLLALPYRPAEVVQNLRSLGRLGVLGTHGLYEALDFTNARLSVGQKYAIVREYMAHHQGMILLAVSNYLQGGLMPRRFAADLRIQSVLLLLEERVPADAPLEFPQPGDVAPVRRAETPTVSLPWSVPVPGPVPHVHYLSNGQYHVLVTGSGAGVSRWRDLELTRWRADTTLDDWGTWIYIEDLATGKLWSATQQPTGTPPDSQAVRFHAHMAEYQRQDGDIVTRMELAVAPDDDLEIRRLTIVNQGEETRRLAVTSYGEVVMAPGAADLRHPAFNKLFIESEYLPEMDLLLFRRRPRSDAEAPVYLAHLALSDSQPDRPSQYEGDRARFLGRWGTVRRPAALCRSGSGLTGMIGATLDPIMCIQREIELEPGEVAHVAFMTVAAGSRDALLGLAGRYRSWLAIDDAFAQAQSRAELELTQLGLSSIEVERFQALLSALTYPSGVLRAAPAILAANRLGQQGLWGFGISGDYPILLVKMHGEDDLGFIRELLEAHAYWRRRLLKIDLVILNQRPAGYSTQLRDQLHRLMVRMQSETWLGQRGGIFVLNGDQVAEVDRVLLESTARVVLDPADGLLAAQLEALRRPVSYLPAFSPEWPEGAGQGPELELARPPDLLYDNGLGGFAVASGPEGGDSQGREYLLFLQPGQAPPVPWSNVMANPEYGCLVTEAGSSCTWALNSGENRLTTWQNDPVTDPSGEVLYLRDEETGDFWTPTPQPCPAQAPFVIRHGAGYTVFEHNSHGLGQRLRTFVAPDDPVKIVHLRLENHWNRSRRITATFYVEWVLGVTRCDAQQHVVTDFDDETQALLARSHWNPEFAGKVAFLSASQRLHGLTADRTEFLGRLGSYSRPAALQRIGLGSNVQPGTDPCAALQLHVDLAPGEAVEVWFVLGQGADRDHAIELAKRYKAPEQLAGAWEALTTFWDGLLGAIQVHTPDPAMDLLLNRWLLYQALSCRIWGRTALYQSSGAFGFRDQLQDVMAMLHAAPGIAREQILRAARHQFEAGDVLHWWHPPAGRGVRTRCSDDLLWLPYVTAHYVQVTGDDAILEEEVPFLRAASLAPDEEERYGLYPQTDETYTLYEHCRRAIDRGVTAGAHGLPLMGSGDWNDGMNRVGIEGRGESVWLGWFIHATLTRFARLCARRGDEHLAEKYLAQAAQLSQAIDAHAWDGAWYLRAFYDDGTPLGSASSEECQIDAIAQSWAVLSAAGQPGRASQAMGGVLRQLVRPEEGLVLLFTPPFDRTPRDPGYIKGYLPGIRENGGQYTHAAIWSIWAFAELGDGDTADALFRLINPVLHADTAIKVHRYKVEPYVVAADVYGVVPHTGRGGWTWYTGSAAWMYRLGIEGLLGLRRTAGRLQVTPHIPAAWPGYSVDYRHGRSTYEIRVQNRSGGARQPTVRLTLDGTLLSAPVIELVDDGQRHRVDVELIENQA